MTTEEIAAIKATPTLEGIEEILKHLSLDGVSIRTDDERGGWIASFSVSHSKCEHCRSRGSSYFQGTGGTFSKAVIELAEDFNKHEHTRR